MDYAAVNVGQLTITLTAAITLLASVVAVTAAIITIRERVKLHAEELERHDEVLEKYAARMLAIEVDVASQRTTMAVLLQKMEYITQAVDEIKKWLRNGCQS